jgi:hypothetical protein
MLEKEKEFLELVPSAIKDKHRSDGLKLTRARFLRDVFFDRKGFHLPVLLKTKTGEPTTDRRILLRLRDELEDSPAKEALSVLIEWGPYRTLYSTYLNGFEDAMKCDGRLHTQITKAGTATGRTSCIRKGSLVEVCRDVGLQPRGVPIEDVKVGDYVYSFTDNGRPAIKRVLWSGCTGRRELIRVRFKNQKGEDRGYLDLTPEHPVRLSTGQYIEARNLLSGMSVCSVYRSFTSFRYANVWLTNRKKVNEHRFIYEQVYGELSDDYAVHHKDGNRCNNQPSNLEALPVGDHARLHVRQGDMPKHTTLADKFGRRSLLRMLARAKGRPTKTDYDFESIKRAFSDSNINWREAAKRYNGRGEFLSKGMVKNTLYMTQNQALEYLGVGYYRWQELLDFYGFARPRLWCNQFGAFRPHVNNHLVDSVDWLNEEDVVYDLEVEDTHNFVVNGISVHNSASPNLQNIPKRNAEIMRAIRSMLCAPPGKVLVSVDYSQSELRWIAHESGDRNMVGIFQRGEDMHVVTGKGLAEKKGFRWEYLDEKTRKKYRQDAKPVNFGLPYGQSAKGFLSYARDSYGVVFTLKEAEEYRFAFLNILYPGLVPWHERRKQEARKNGFVRSEYGFIRRTPNILCGDQYKQGEDERIAINTGIQSASNDSTLLAALEARRAGIVDDCRAKIVLFIHDELIYEVDEDYVDEFTPKLISHMENLPTERFGFKMRVPLVAEAKIGTILSEMRDYKQEQQL